MHEKDDLGDSPISPFCRRVFLVPHTLLPPLMPPLRKGRAWVPYGWQLGAGVRARATNLSEEHKLARSREFIRFGPTKGERERERWGESHFQPSFGDRVRGRVYSSMLCQACNTASLQIMCSHNSLLTQAPHLKVPSLTVQLVEILTYYTPTEFVRIISAAGERFGHALSQSEVEVHFLQIFMTLGRHMVVENLGFWTQVGGCGCGKMMDCGSERMRRRCEEGDEFEPRIAELTAIIF